MMCVLFLIILLHLAHPAYPPATLTEAVNRVGLAMREAFMAQFDLASFKILAANDTSAAPGHQGGIVIPKDLAHFFPPLPEASSSRPTVDVPIEAELWIGENYIGTVSTRFQHQTWGGTRSPERRLTSHLAAIRDKAEPGDVVLFQRSIDEDAKIRLTLIRKDTQLFRDLQQLLNGRRWGPLSDMPVTNSQLEEGVRAVEETSSSAFQLFKPTADRVESRVVRIARERAFRNGVLNNFSSECAFSGRVMIAPNGEIGLDAAHIVPVSLRGADDLRNGLALSKELHWAFDRGLLAVHGGKVAVASSVVNDSRNAYLQAFANKPIDLSSKIKTSISHEALDWHYTNIFLG